MHGQTPKEAAMQIQQVEYSRLQTDNGRCSAVVTLVTPQGAMHCTCWVETSAAQSPDALRDALLDEALRQARRMPEFRPGHVQLTLAA
jgi:hypothetical protein